MKTIAQINERIKKGDAVVVSADEMPGIVDEIGVKKAAEKVDVVTTGTFGAMCSSGAFLSFGHSNPPIKMERVWLNEVEAYTGLAAVDAYVGATQLSEEKGFEYGGGHVIEDLIAGKNIDLRATAYGTDCYPTKKIETSICLDDLNQAMLFNPRNNYQKYVAATNSSPTKIRTYMGTLLPNNGNVNFAGTGQISPLLNDPDYETIGFGTKIFLGGALGRVVGEGTQHSPQTGFGTIAVKADLKDMDSRFIRGATIEGYGTSLLVGIGIPIPVLNERIARSTAVTNDKITTNLLDYGVARTDRPTLKTVTYAELFSKSIEFDGQDIKCAPLSSMRISREIMDITASWIADGAFQFSLEVERLPNKMICKPMKLTSSMPKISQIMTKKVYTAKLDAEMVAVSRLMVEKGVDQIPIIDDEKKVVGIVTAYDFTRAVAERKTRLDQVMSKNVISSQSYEGIDEVSRKLQKFGYNSMPVVDELGTLVGIVTLSDINRAYGGMKK